jgi:hypothetical protein
MNLTLEKARADYPLAWRSIQQQIAEVRAAGADVVALDARVIEVRGTSTLEVTALADYVAEDDDDAPASAMRFQAPIAERPKLRLVSGE